MIFCKSNSMCYQWAPLEQVRIVREIGKKTEATVKIYCFLSENKHVSSTRTFFINCIEFYLDDNTERITVTDSRVISNNSKYSNQF